MSSPPFSTPKVTLLGPGAFRLFLAAMVAVQHLGPFAVGTWAVNVFFILSGFWVAHMWEERYRHCRQPYWTFVVSRFWRLWPLYALCTAATFTLIYWKGRMWQDVVETLSSPGWVARAAAIVSSASQKKPLPQIWSLDVEMQFYLVLPLLCLGAAWLERRQKVARFGLSTILTLACAGLVMAGNPPFLPFHLLFFVIGLALNRTRWSPSLPGAVGSLGLAGIVAAALWLGPWHDLLDPVQVDLQHPANREANRLLCAGLTLLTIPFVAHNVRVRTGPLDHHLGQLAYPVYLWHFVPALAANFLLRGRGYSEAIVASFEWGLVVVGSLLLYFLFDRPIDAWRRAWVKSRQAAPTTRSVPQG